jgi:general secretion pathway protein E
MDIGYRGRTGVYELLSINEKIRAAILANADAGTIRNMAIEGGMVPLRNAGLELALQGVTTLEEVIRVTQEEN